MFQAQKAVPTLSVAVNYSARAACRRPSQVSSFASQRATRTAWVLDARSSHQPSAVFTRTPSIPSTSAPAAASRSRTSATTANLRASGQGKRSSGVRSEEHTSELQSLMRISYAVFCLKKKNKYKRLNEDVTIQD